MRRQSDPNSTESPLEKGRLVLASASPRRSALLDEMGLEFEIHPADIDETPFPDEVPRGLVRRLARSKAQAVTDSRRIGERRFILGSDTLVVLDDEPIGKPADSEDAIRMLERLTGRIHTVMTGIAVLDVQTSVILDQVVESQVHMRDASRDEISRYVALGESLDKAGAYALQGEGRRFVTQVEGSESNVIGLPLEETRALLEKATPEAGDVA